MDFKIPTQDEIVTKYEGFNEDLSQEEVLVARTAELNKLNKEDLVALIIEQESTKRTGTVQELAKSILKDDDFIAASYETIANAICEIMPGTKTSSKSIASYVSKKREEWELPQRIRISKA